ncbi:hypothetical protein KA005_11190 [bacterium]|nr:hypothetical protein [bacterium]
MAKIEPVLIAAMIRPELATAFVVTKRVAEMVGMLLQVVFSSFLPSFSHLYAQNQIKAAQILSKTISMSLIAGVIGYGAYVAGNQSFINLWVGGGNFVGQDVTIMIALGLMLMGTQSFLYQLLVGTGDIAGPSYLMLAESLLRVLLMTLFLYWLGLLGLPLAMLLSCGVFSIVFYQRLTAKVIIDFFSSRACPKLLIIFVTTFGIYAWLGSKISNIESWAWFVFYMAVITVGLCVFLLMSNPDTHAFIMKKKEALFNDKIIT